MLNHAHCYIDKGSTQTTEKNPDNINERLLKKNKNNIQHSSKFQNF